MRMKRELGVNSSSNGKPISVQFMKFLNHAQMLISKTERRTEQHSWNEHGPISGKERLSFGLKHELLPPNLLWKRINPSLKLFFIAKKLAPPLLSSGCGTVERRIVAESILFEAKLNRSCRFVI
ncbi:hypothetical protein D5086_011537 [Populus alba]|uniref:Uncharacterized protein n=1 Tax=Populus alba TaxID=43335 RepID=A0ACC4CCI2_POPAL